MTQSKTDLSFGILLIVFSGLEKSVVTEIYNVVPRNTSALSAA